MGQNKSGIGGDCERREDVWIECCSGRPILAAEDVRVARSSETAVARVIAESGIGRLAVRLVCGQTVVRARAGKIVGVDKAGSGRFAPQEERNGENAKAPKALETHRTFTVQAPPA